MSQNILFNGTVYTIPDVADDSWGQNLTDYFVAIASGALQKTGGTFTLTTDVNFGASKGLLAAYFSTRTALPSTAGLIRLSNTESIGWRNAANGANLLLSVNASDQLTFNGNPIVPSTALTANRALISGASGLISVSAVTSTELAQLSGITSAVVGINDTQTLTNKTLTAPIIATISNTGLLTLPTSTDTLVGRATTDTLTNKTWNGSVIGAQYGGTGQSSLTANNVILGNGTSAVQFVAPGNTGNILQDNGTTWISAAPAAATYTAPKVTPRTSGSGTHTFTGSPLYVTVEMVGAGGGGAGSATQGANDAGNGGNGGDTTFGPALLSAGGGAGAAKGNSSGGAGGTSSLGSGPTGIALSGGRGEGAISTSAGSGTWPGGSGAGSAFGGAGLGSSNIGQNPGVTNTGAGGSGGSFNSAGAAAGFEGSGGGAGGYVKAWISGATLSGLSGSAAYAVGAAGTAGSAGTSGNAGAAGGSGLIIITEYYQ